MADKPTPKAANRYAQLIERVFLSRHVTGADTVTFDRQDITAAAEALGVTLPKNLGDVIYSFRYRVSLPDSVAQLAPSGKQWLIRPAGRSKYCFAAVVPLHIAPNPALAETKVPDATPGIIAMYALSDEQALLAKLRYNRLVDVFTGVACYSLQSHLRTFVPGIGQTETDEVYIGLDKRGAHFVFPVQAKGGRDALGPVQVEQDIAMCQARFPNLICRPIAAQFVETDLIALLELEETDQGIRIGSERHYRLVHPDALSDEDVAAYRARPD